MAAIACWSSSFSACTVPSRRHASAFLGLACTSASRAKHASVSTPRLNRSLPLLKASGSPMKGLSRANTYSPFTPPPSTELKLLWPYIRSHSWNVSSSPALNSCTHVLAASSQAFSRPPASPSRFRSATPLANSSAQSPCVVEGAAVVAENSLAQDCAGRTSWAANSDAQEAACGLRSTTLLSSNSSSPLLILDTNCRNLELRILGSASRDRMSTSARVLCIASDEVAAALRACALVSVADVNSDAQASPG
mmetsp:Transcript_38367/g.85414  ORF Transcript_38367/g.85414 Transcript_38367/m.85414 type:complete len:251 (-) Transcript_38367:1073-1825(-)